MSSILGYFSKNRIEFDVASELAKISEMELRNIDLDTSIFTFEQGGITAQQKINNAYYALDGQIYNWRSLTDIGSDDKRLAVFKSFRTNPKEASNKWSGKWAITEYDADNQIVRIGRDQSGGKPMYYFFDENHFYFGSTLADVIAFKGHNRAIDERAAYDFLVNGQIDKQEATLFNNIKSVVAGEVIEVDLKSWKLKSQPHNHRTWFYRIDKSLSFDQAKSKIKDLVVNAVQERLDYEGTNASLLSGGLDSSILVSVLNKLNSGVPTTFTAAFAQKQFSELPYAQKVIDFTNANAHISRPTAEELAKDLEQMMLVQNTPTISSSTYAQFRLFESAMQNGQWAVFDGQGADALFGGHYYYDPFYWLDLWKSRDYTRLKAEVSAFGGTMKAFKYWLKNYVKYKMEPSFPVWLQTKIKQRYFKELPYLNPDFYESNKVRAKDNSLNEFSFLTKKRADFERGGLNSLLKCVERSATHFGVQAYTPYSDDPALIDYVNHLPSHFFIEKGTRKHILKEAFKDWLPKEVYERNDKMGLMTPNNEWMAALRPQLRAYFEALDGQFLNKKLILKDFDQLFNPKSSIEDYKTYKLISFAVWRKVFEI